MPSSTDLSTESNYKRYGLQPETDHDDDNPPYLIQDRYEPIIARSSSFHSLSTLPTSRSRQSSPNHSPRLGPSRLSSFHRSHSSFSSSPFTWNAWGFLKNWKLQLNPPQQHKGKLKAGKSWYRTKRVKGLLLLIGLLGSFFLVNWIMLTRLQDEAVHPITELSRNSSADSVSVSVQGKWKKTRKGKKPQKGNYERLLALATHALAENKREPKDLWQEPFAPASSWRPCADQRDWEPSEGNNGYILVTANGGINQQRVAVCNAVVVARLLNSTLVIPKFMFSSVWRDVSQFSGIYQEEHFIKYLTPDIRIVRELPEELQSLDLEAIGSVVSDVDMGKEAPPSFYLKHILPILLKNQVVHFVGFGNRLAFDPIPFGLQVAPAYWSHWTVGSISHWSICRINFGGKRKSFKKTSKYLSLHLRFEIDMVAHSLCEFGGGEGERKELAAYREIHFPALAHLEKTTKLPSPLELRSEGLCPLTPEEAVLMLAALGFNRKTHIFVAGSNLYGGQSRLTALTSLYPNLVTKENLLSSTELEPFANYSSQLAALDFIGCTAADAFAMTDSGSQLSSLVSGFRIYYGGGKMPTIRPNKRRLASIFTKNSTIEWRVFEQRLRKAVRQTKHVQTRPRGRSVYRYPRCRQCMCRTD